MESWCVSSLHRISESMSPDDGGREPEDPDPVPVGTRTPISLFPSFVRATVPDVSCPGPNPVRTTPRRL